MRRTRSPQEPDKVRQREAPPTVTRPQAQPLIELQAMVGNEVVNRLLDDHLQTKLVVGSVDDPAERQADRVAQVVLQRLGEGPASAAASAPGTDTPVEVDASGGAVTAATERDIAASAGAGFALSLPVRRTMEEALGADLGAVRIHTGARARGLNQRLGSRAFTVGSNIFFRDAAPDMARRDGQHLLAHELAHAIQQGTSVRGPQRDAGNAPLSALLDRSRPSVQRNGDDQPPAEHGGPARAEHGGPAPAERIDPAAVKVTLGISPGTHLARRRHNQFGVGEKIDLSYALEPAVRPEQLGGLIWEVKGPADLDVPKHPRPRLTATKAAGPQDVTVNLKIRTGAHAETVMATETIRVIPPTGVAMEMRDDRVHHYEGLASAGFVGRWFFQPADVSFHNLEFREEACPSVTHGCFAKGKWAEGHQANPKWGGTTPGEQDARGTPISGTDTVFSGYFRPCRETRPATKASQKTLAFFGFPERVMHPYKSGDFEPGKLVWNIPVSYRIVGTAEAVPFGYENQEMECYDDGDMRIRKLGVEVTKSAGPPKVVLPEIERGYEILKALRPA